MKTLVKNLLAALVITTSVAHASDSVVSTIGNNLLDAGKNIAVTATNLVGASVYSGSFGAKWLSSGLKGLTERPALLAAVSVATGYGLYYNYITNKHEATLADVEVFANIAHPNSKLRNRTLGLGLLNWRLHGDNALTTDHIQDVNNKDAVKTQLLANYPVTTYGTFGRETMITAECIAVAKELSDVRLKLLPFLCGSEFNNSTSYSSNYYINQAFILANKTLKMSQRVIFPNQKRASELHAQLTAMIERLEAIKEAIK